jgi:broad-specificity NMP kinase
VTDRRVVLVCGPPGAGKTTRARALAEAEGLAVYDWDDPQWIGEAHFLQAMRAVGADASARAVVIRCAATRARRAQAAALCRATDIEVLVEDPEVCLARILERGRGDVRKQMRGVRTWFAEERADRVPYRTDAPAPTRATRGVVSRAW